MLNQLLSTARGTTVLDYRANQTVTEELEVGYVNHDLRIQLDVDYTNTGDPGIAFHAGLLRLIRRIEIEVDDTDQVLSLDAVGLLTWAQYDFRRLPSGYGDPARTVANHVYNIQIPISFILRHSMAPFQTALDLRGANKCTISIYWGTAADIFPTPGNCTINSVSTRVIQMASAGVSRDTPIAAVRDLSMSSHDIQATQQGYELSYEKRTNRRLRRILLQTSRLEYGNGIFSAAANKVIVGDIQAFSGGEQFAHVPAIFGTQEYQNTHNSDIDGSVYPVDFERYGNPDYRLDMNALQSELKLRFDVQGPIGGDKTTIRNYPEYVRPLRTRI